ncbi:MAG TPA: sugar phosphate isomerase/epimerase [Terriglobia bacterium]|nr:sugar phosphate isomerase/epimerase [Terriglobia bacterium]
MKKPELLSRRSFLSAAAVAPLAAAGRNLWAAGRAIPIGLELYSVRHELQKNLMGTVTGVAKMGYQCVEFFAPYYDWTPGHAKQVRKQLDSLSVRCYSTHNGPVSFSAAGIGKAIQLNQILGSRFVVLAYPGNINTLDGWKGIADMLNNANTELARHGMHAGYHNHDAEWKPIDGQAPMEVLATNTDKSIMLQLDVGTCVAAGSNPVAWINSHPGRIRSLHLKDWSPKQGYRVLFGQGVAPWKKIFAAAETWGGVEYYLIEQEGSNDPEMKTAELCLKAYRKLHA